MVAELDGSASEGDELLLLVTDDVSVSSGIVANFFRTCFRAGRLMGLLKLGCQCSPHECGMRGLPQKHVHSGVIAVFDIAFLGKCSECDDGSRIPHLTDESGTLKTIQVWHLWSISSCF